MSQKKDSIKTLTLNDEEYLVLKNIRLERKVCELEIALIKERIAGFVRKEKEIASVFRERMKAEEGDLMIDLEKKQVTLITQKEA